MRERLPKLGAFFAMLWDDFVAIDGRLLATLRTLIVPGQLPLDWITGKQARYVAPGRLLAFLVFLFAIHQTFMVDASKQDSLTNLVSGIAGASIPAEWSEELRNYRLQQAATVVAIIGIPLLGFWMFLYNKASLFYTNCVFTVHLLCTTLVCFFALKIVTRPLKWSMTYEAYQTLLSYMVAITLLLLFGYLVVAAKRVFAIGYMGALIKTMLFLLLFIASLVVLVQLLFSALP